MIQFLLFLFINLNSNYYLSQDTENNFEHKVYFDGTNYKLDVFIINGKEKAKTLMIVGGIHGDEVSAYMAADLYTDTRLKKGTIIVIPRVNLNSIILNQRFSNVDMNRRFITQGTFEEEDKVVDVIKRYIKQADLVLNLHEGSGFFNTNDVNKLTNSNKMGQSIVADCSLCNFNNKKIDLKNIAEEVILQVNKNIDNKDYFFKFNNTESIEEQKSSLTYYAISKLNVPSFGIEVSKEIKDLELKINMHKDIINTFSKYLGIEFDFPKIKLEKPEFNYLITKINDKYEILTNNKTLNIKKGSTFLIKDVSSNYNKGITVDILGYGSIDDIDKKFIIEKNSEIIVRKDSMVIAKLDIKID